MKCGQCVSVCPTGAISLFDQVPEKVEVPETMAQDFE
ncbi:hypothetical protein KIPB_016273, partial [Kipferlia bialata]|eukprot:g16273.t1